ncbi:Dolichyl-monophosphooligosaccharide--protein glycosyltransferase AglB [Thermoplasmatales archaeon]|nr:Dolichyl-monophosphooligosaccharide--protein glycosyltransferase AglB [Thermoplasmatales archaeon]
MELSYRDSSSGKEGFIRKYPEAVVLTVLVGFYLFLANYFAWSVTFQNGFFTTSGGSDPYYNWINILHVIQTGHWLSFDPTLNYPLGSVNPRTPFFHILVVFIAVVLSPFMNITSAALLTFEELDAFFGALLIIPVYLIGKEVFGKKGGMVAALLYMLMPSNISAGYLSDGRIHTPELIFVLFAIYFFERTIVTIDKGKIIDKLYPPTRIFSSIRDYYRNNRLPTIYALFAGASLGALMLSWQGYAYAVVILLLYVIVQYFINLFLKRPSDYLVYSTSITVFLGFLLGAYYYIGIGNYSIWLTPVFLLSILVIIMGFVFMAIRSKPWVISVPVIAVLGAGLLAALAVFDTHSFNTLISGDGYFIKTRVYQTIAEAASLPLGQYISGFGVFEFVLGMGGIAYAIYMYLKEKKDSMFFILVFSLVSIYMSFEAARFNITAAPAYAVLGAGLLLYFAHVVKLYDLKRRSGAPSASIKKAIKGNISWVHVVFVFIIVTLLIIPSGLGVISSSIPVNNAAKYNQEIYNTIPGILQPPNFTASSLYYVGATGSLIDNKSQPLAQSFAWLATQNANKPINDKPAYVSWWDYGFQELQQGLHPTVADDFQQGYQVAGQILLAQNQSQIVALFIARTIEVEYDKSTGGFTPNVSQVLTFYFGPAEASFLAKIYANPQAYDSLILKNPSIYGKYINSIGPTNAYFALIKGQLASKYSMSTLVNAYSALEQVTGYSIQYIQADHALFPSSVNNTGTFYAPSYLTDTPSYATAGGGVVPTNYYNVIVDTTNGTYPLQNVSTTATVTNEYLQYTPAFYNTTIYRLQIGFPASAVGVSNGIPGLVSGTTNLTIMPAWNMSNFEIVYELIPWNPYTNYAAHPNAWQDIPLQQAYTYLKEGIGTAVIFPSTSQMLGSSDPIVSYYPGAIINGRVTNSNGLPIGGVNVTLYDQYGIPHSVVQTNANGYYNLTAVPGNDTVVFSTGALNPLYLYGKNILKEQPVYVSTQQAERQTLAINSTTGMPNYYIQDNYQAKTSEISGTAFIEYQNIKNANASLPGQFSTKKIETGTVFLTNSTYNTNISIPIVNGAYVLNNIQPYNYHESLLVNGTYYPDILQANITIGGSLVYDAIVYFDSLFVNTSSSFGLSPGYTVKAVDGSTVYSNVTNSAGHANLWVQPGTYSVYATKGSSQTNVTTVTFSNWGQNSTLSLSASMSATVSGTIYNSRAGNTIFLYPDGQISSAYKTTINTGGQFSITVPYGIYTLYASSGSNAVVKTIDVESNVSVTATMSLSYSLTVSASLSAVSAYSGYYEIMSNSTFLKYSYSTPGPYSIMLPEGFYGVMSAVTYLGNFQTGFQSIYLISNRSVSPMLTFANQQTVSLHDSSGSAINSGISVLYSSGNPVYFGTIGSGTATLYYTNQSKLDLSSTSMAPLYSSVTASITGSSQSVTMNPVTVKANFTLFNNNQKLDGIVNLTLTGTNTYYLHGNENGISASVVPGVYLASASNGTSTLKLAEPAVVIPNSANQKILLSATPYATLKVNETNYTVFNSTGYAVNASGPLPFGNYLVYTYSNVTGSPVASWNLYSLNANRVVTPSNVSARVILLKNSLGIGGGHYTLTINGTTANLTTDKVYIPTTGSYSVQYYNTVVNSTGSYVVSGSGTISTTSTGSFTINVKSNPVNTVLTGQVTIKGSPLENTAVQILSTSGKYIAEVTTNSDGFYTVSLPSGTWEIYALNNATGTGYFNGVTIPAFSGTYYDNFSLVNTYLTKVIVTVGSVPQKTNVVITEYPYNIMFNTSQTSLLLPLGNYSFYASVTQTMTAFNNTVLTVTYSENDTIEINSTQSVTLSLSQQVTGNVVITQAKNYPQIQTGLNLTNSTLVRFNVTNRQNVYNDVTLSSGSPSWVILFNETHIGLAPGQTKSVNATVYAMKNPQAGIEAVPINMSYSSSTSSGIVNVDVVPRLSYSTHVVSIFGTPQGNNLVYQIKLVNTGNAPITVTGKINSSTNVNLYGWTATLVYNGKAAGPINVPYSQSVTVDVILSPTGSAYSPGGTVYADFNATINGSTVTEPVLLTVEYPYTSIVPSPSGNGIIPNYTGDALATLFTGLIIIAVTVVAGLVIASMRGRRFRR